VLYGARIIYRWRVFIMKEELTSADYLYSVKIGSLLGFFAGWAIGVALLLYVNSPALNNWPGVPSIPLWNGLGWATYGFIIGGSGIFSRVGKKPATRREPIAAPLKPALDGPYPGR
jgi:hypothetical protein